MKNLNWRTSIQMRSGWAWLLTLNGRATHLPLSATIFGGWMPCLHHWLYQPGASCIWWCPLATLRWFANNIEKLYEVYMYSYSRVNMIMTENVWMHVECKDAFPYAQRRGHTHAHTHTQTHITQTQHRSMHALMRTSVQNHIQRWMDGWIDWQVSRCSWLIDRLVGS